MKLIESVKIALLFLHVTLKLLVYDLKLVCVFLHLSVKEVFKTIYLQEQNNNISFIEWFLVDLEISLIPPNEK